MFLSYLRSLQNGRYIGAAHQSCNLQRSYCTAFPTFVHNLDKYDGCFIAMASMKYANRYKWKLGAIPQNRERFLSFDVGPFLFRDSLHFIPASLSEMVGQVKDAKYSFPLLRKLKWKKLDGEKHLELMQRKGVFPYKYVTSVRQMRECTSLPEKCHFYSELSEENISDEDYAFAQEFWRVSGCETLLDYCHIYVILDTLLLASVVTVRRHEIYEEYKLDMAQFLSAPHLTYNVLLSTMKDKVELLTDVDMFTM